MIQMAISMGHESDYYSILGLESRATPEAIRAAFTALISKLPEGMDPAKDPAYKEILQAYKVLSNPERRAVYDSLLSETESDELRVDVQTSREQLSLSDAQQLAYLLVDIYSPEQDVDAKHPLNICVVIDRSTSMQGDRLERIITAVEMILDKLRPEDVLSLISFSDRAEVVLPAGHIESSHIVSSRIRKIEASGGTEIYQGLLAGIKEMQRFPLARHTNHLILMTDGHTYGDEAQCLRLAEGSAKHGVTFSAIGIGTEWNDEFLDKLVAPSGGQSVFIEAPEEILQRLQSQITGLGQVHARNVRLEAKFPKSVTLKYGYKMTPFAQPLDLNDGQINLGDVEGQTPLSFLLELEIAPQRIETRINIELNFRVDLPTWGAKEKAISHQEQFLILSDAVKAEPSPSLVKAVRMLNMYRMNEKAWNEVEAGDIDRAAKRMRHLSTRLLEIGETSLAKQAYAETERLATMGALSPEGRKRLKYGTRALISGLREDQSSERGGPEGGAQSGARSGDD